MENLDIETNEKHTEFETKYRVEIEDLVKFKRLVTNFPNVTGFVYAEGPDHYYVKPGTDSFQRYRKEDWKEGGRAELTKKVKPQGAKNNNIRKEWNIRVDGTPKETIFEAIEEDGYRYNFSIWKSCHIYHTTEATLVFYSLVDVTDKVEGKEVYKPEKVHHFLEIEVNEDSIDKITEEEAWDVIKRYEEALSPLGISAQKRLRKSLFEMFVRRE